jgi:hypothetical protein
MLWGLSAAAAVLSSIYVGSRGLRDFDTALVPYAGASVLAAFGIGYRYAMWLRRPPTRLYWKRGWQLFLRPADALGNVASLGGLLWRNVVAQTFIERRSRLRWAAHFCIFWGCVLAAAVTFPLSFGWIRFETAADTQEVYRAFVFGLRVLSFRLDGPLAPFVFHVLVVSAVLVLIGVFLALWRRARSQDALAVQRFANDLLPLVLLFAISVTGILLTVSARFLNGFYFTFLSQFHAVTVIFTLLYLPFGKFFHIFQRPAQLSLEYYRRAGARTGPARCARCGEAFASRLHIADLKLVEEQLGIRFGAAGSPTPERENIMPHYQDVCPACRRRNLAVVQDAAWHRAGRGREA